MATQTDGATGTSDDGVVGRLAGSRLTLALAGPTAAWFAVFLLLPVLFILYYSFLTYRNFDVVHQVTLTAWTSSVVSGTTLSIFATTIAYGAVVTLLSLAVGYPVAYFLRFYVGQTVGFLTMLLFIIPFWTSPIIRTLGWYPILGKQGVLNKLLLASGLIHAPVGWFLFSPFAMLLGYLENYVVFMFVPIYVSLLTVDDDLLGASETLRARPWRTFRRVTWPLSLPGVAIGSLFVFVMTIGDFVVPQNLSGGQSTAPGLIYLQISNGLNYPSAAALSMTLLVIILVIVGLLLRRVDITETF